MRGARALARGLAGGELQPETSRLGATLPGQAPLSGHEELGREKRQNSEDGPEVFDGYLREIYFKAS